MDANRGANKRVCVTYLITFLLLTGFFFYLMSGNQKNIKGIIRLREDVDDISHMLREQQQKQVSCPSKSDKFAKFKCLAGDPGDTETKCSSTQVNAYVHELIRSKIGNLMDDVYNIKKQIMGSGCSSHARQPSEPNHPDSVAIGKSRINYAAEELGARILSVKANPIGGFNIIKSFLGLDFSSNAPINMLRSSLTPGSCFGYSGNESKIELRLAKSIIVEAIAVGHISKEMAPSKCVESAPKDFQVVGIAKKEGKQVELGRWKYENSPQKRLQVFKVTCNCFLQDLIFSFSSNHGAKTTCIYRLEVYGRI